MRTILTTYMIVLMAIAPVFANNDMSKEPADTVVIELENGSKIIIYTRDRVELKKLQGYNVNEMIRDLNQSLGDNNVDYLELENGDGDKYLIDSPNVLFGEGEGDGDTVVIDRESLDNIRIRVGGLELDIDPENFDVDDFDDELELKKYSYVQEETERTRNFFNMDIGSNNWLSNGTPPSESNAPYAVKPFGSWYLGLNWLNKTWVGGSVFLEWGGGVSWYNWKMEDTDIEINKGATQIEFLPVANTISGQKSKLTASYINFSVVPMLDFSRGSKKVKATSGRSFTFKTYRKSGFRIGGGMYAGYRMGSRTKFIFKEDGNKEKNKESDHFYLQNFRYGVRGQLGFRSFDMFVLYDLNEVFASGRGPGGAKLNAFTIGVTL
ncbi:MAG: hypothetical protein GY816_18530 [Cytophagales bacterium]|nr:hypothetical protein [Cytophagales bacterium]